MNTNSENLLSKKSFNLSLAKVKSDKAYVLQSNEILFSHNDQIFCAKANQMYVWNYFRTPKRFCKPDFRRLFNRFGLIEKKCKEKLCLLNGLSHHTHKLNIFPFQVRV